MRSFALSFFLLTVCLPVANAASEAQIATRCAEGSREHKDAEVQLKQFEKAITEAPDDAPVAPLVTQLSQLLETPCFLVAHSVWYRPGEHVTLFALKTWWEDGGKTWVSHQLYDSRDVLFPPSVRKTLTLDSAPKHPLARLLCRARDASCGQETAGWAARAARAFRAGADSQTRWHDHSYSSDLYQRTTPPKEEENQGPLGGSIDLPLWRCAHPDKKKGAKLDYTKWQECVENLRVKVATLPLGHFRAPTSGWLVIRGRRGHHRFCDQLSAYDLSTGAYYASKSCSSLALMNDGSVDRSSTDAARQPKIETGRLSIENLREAAWMIFLSNEIDNQGYPDLDSFPMPPGLEPKVEVGGFGALGMSGWGSSSQTTLAWAWIDGGKLIAEGTFTWPDSSNWGETHADDLLRVAEAGLQPGCPPAPLPDPILGGCGKTGVSSLDGKASNLCKIQSELSERLSTFKCSGWGATR